MIELEDDDHFNLSMRLILYDQQIQYSTKFWPVTEHHVVTGESMSFALGVNMRVNIASIPWFSHLQPSLV